MKQWIVLIFFVLIFSQCNHVEESPPSGTSIHKQKFSLPFTPQTMRQRPVNNTNTKPATGSLGHQKIAKK
ncbi:MAG: hypothetical protein ACOYNU_02130, partial [Bacteroidales bacterium]